LEILIKKMNIFLIAALTADGLIARHKNHLADWTSKEDKTFFRKKTPKGSVVIMGSTTYKTIGKPLPGRLSIIYTRNPSSPSIEGENSVAKQQKKGVLRFTNLPPKTLIKSLKRESHKTIAICGGSTIYTMFLKSGLVQKLYLTIEPILFGKGLTLFNQNIDKKLKLIKIHKISKQSVVLEYNL